MEEDYQKRSGQIPAFGNWDYANDLPITQYFECARQAGLARPHCSSSSSGECGRPHPHVGAGLSVERHQHRRGHPGAAPLGVAPRKVGSPSSSSKYSTAGAYYEEISSLKTSDKREGKASGACQGAEEATYNVRRRRRRRRQRRSPRTAKGPAIRATFRQQEEQDCQSTARRRQRRVVRPSSDGPTKTTPEARRRRSLQNFPGPPSHYQEEEDAGIHLEMSGSSLLSLSSSSRSRASENSRLFTPTVSFIVVLFFFFLNVWKELIYIHIECRSRR